jgi:hypothetical protein
MKFSNSFLFIFSLFLLKFSNISAESMTSIKGYAPKYIGEKVEIYAIEDYCSLKERLIASTQVKDDSTFVVNFFNSKTQKIIIKSKNNKDIYTLNQMQTTKFIFQQTTNTMNTDLWEMILKLVFLTSKKTI